VAVAFARLLSKRGNVIAGKVEKPLITLEVSSYYTRTIGLWSFLSYRPSVSSACRTRARARQRTSASEPSLCVVSYRRGPIEPSSPQLY
jgi:hypothetical protein